MKKGTKIALITAIILIVVGLILLAIITLSGGTKEVFKQTKETKRIDIPQAFGSIDIDCKSGGVSLLRSETGDCRVVAEQTQKIYFTAEVKDGRLTVVQHDDRNWAEKLFGFSIIGVKVAVYLPEKQYESLSAHNLSGSVEVADPIACGSADIRSSSGSVRLNGLDCAELTAKCSSGSVRLADIKCGGSVDISSGSGSVTVEKLSCAAFKAECSSGRITLSDIECSSAEIEASSGKVTMERMIAAELIDVDVSSGGIEFTSIDAPRLKMETGSGSIHGSVLTGKLFKASTGSGSIHVPADDPEGGVFELETGSGSISVTVAG